MTDSNLKIDIRRNKILELVRQHKKVYVSELSRTLGVTPVTIRNDLAALESDGYVDRINGGAILSDHDLRFQMGKHTTIENYKEKQAIATAIADMIHDGDTIFINSGTTTEIVAAALKKRKNLNIVTNSIAVASSLSDADTFRIILLGGELNAKYGFTYGADTQNRFDHYHADWAILSIDGISTVGGLTTYHAEEAPIDHMMICESERLLIAADHTKIGRTGFMRVCELSDGICLVTNATADTNAEINALRAMGVQVITA
ncbi:MAG: DeoR/GlpR transcriptional regulator [Clostridia bacterium]|nr:DeoR/GlpR transcriptional regulator [Clostridia bacterium]